MKYIAVVLSLMLLLGFYSISAESSFASTNDVGAYSQKLDGNIDCLAIGVPIGVAYTFRNFGTSDQTSVKVYVFITGPANDVIYRDSGVISNWTAGSERTISFSNFTLPVKGKIDVIAYTNLDNDDDRSNDTNSTKALMVTEYDFKSILIISPAPDTTIPLHSTFKPVGCFINAGAVDLFDVPIRTRITRCSDNTLVFSSDTTIDAIYIDSDPIGAPFPSKQGGNDISNLAPGCYQMSVIGRVSTDGDRGNDTAYSQFTISNTITDNISAMQVISPLDGTTVDPNTIVPITIRFKNTGINSQPSVALSAAITDMKGKTVYQDNINQKGWSANQQYDVQFKNFTPTSIGRYIITGTATLASDQASGDNNIYATLNVGKACDAAINSISIPTLGQVIPFGAGFTPQAAFSWMGFTPSQTDIPVHAEIKDCNGNLMYQADTTIALLSLDNPNMLFTFSGRNASKSIASLPTGCYNLSIRTKLSCDQDNSNDMKTVPFTIAKSCDVNSERVVNPYAAENIPYGVSFTPIGIFSGDANFGEQTDIPVRALIRKCTDNQIVWQVDTTIPILGITSKQFSFTQNSPTLDPGCYQIFLIANLSCDKNHLNDTATVSFTIDTKSGVGKNETMNSALLLEQNFPNPFATTTTISYALPEAGRTSLRVLDMTGRIVQTGMENNIAEAGKHNMILNLQNLPSGIYIYELTFTSNRGETIRRSQRMTLMK